MTNDIPANPGGGPPSFPGNAPPAPPAPPGFPPPQGHYPPPGNFTVPGTMPYASWGLRLGGWLIDFVIFFVVQAVVGALVPKKGALTVHWVMHLHNGTVRHNHLSFVALLITAALAVIYATILFGGPRGQTVGMMAVGVRGMADVGGGQVGYGRALGRALLEQVFRFTIIVWIIDMLFPLWDKKRQTLHDKVVGAVVMRTRHTG
jgi:uncharacterized RDD family membrane protein YckC